LSCKPVTSPLLFLQMPTTAFREIQQCRICGNHDLDLVLSLGTQVLTGVFPRTRDQKISAGPLELVRCRSGAGGETCGLLQLRHSYNPDEMYRGSYGYRSGINQTMTRHLRHVVDSARKLVDVKAGDVVLDIGSNDATLLKSYDDNKLTRVGIDPGGENFRRYYPPEITLVPDYFTAKAFQSNMGQRRAKIVTSIAMFYDLPSPLMFMQDIKEILAPDGVWVFEQSYMPTMLTQNAYDTVCHEHLEYYGLRQIKWMADRVGFKILDVELNDINGGSFRVTVAHEQSPARATSDCTALLAQEKQTGLDGAEPYLAFRDGVYRHRDELRAEIARINQRGELILGYGASTKGNVILQFCGLSEKDVPAIAERNPEKYGCFTPGTLIPIIPEADARQRQPRYLLALPWHFREEFLTREQSFLQGGGRLLFPLPKIEAVGAHR